MGTESGNLNTGTFIFLVEDIMKFQVMGMQALARGDTGAAMAWALKSQDAKFTTYLADKLLSEYATSGDISHESGHQVYHIYGRQAALCYLW
jgi:hypothetical protein